MNIDIEIFSPVQKLTHQLFDEKGLQVFIKRDDLIHPIISGNKWRKLKYLLGAAHVKGKNHLITFGGAYSNHLLAVAASAARFGFKATGFVRGEEADNDMLFMCRLHGMQLIFTSRERYRDKPALFKEYFKNDAKALFINEGGASPEAARGCSELVDELSQTYDHIFCACGTGTTAAGIINGINRHQLKTIFNAIPVFKNGGFMRDEIGMYLEPHPALSKREGCFKLHTDYHFGGYGKTTPELIDFIKTFVADTGILIEPVYTGKTLYALFDLARKDHFKTGSKILAIHTGGIWGLLGMKDRFNLQICPP